MIVSEEEQNLSLEPQEQTTWEDVLWEFFSTVPRLFADIGRQRVAPHW